MKLDSSVLSEARRAVEKKPRFNFTRWLVPLSSTAAILLTATLLFHLQQEQPELLPLKQQAKEFSAPATLGKTSPAPESTPLKEKLMKDVRRQTEIAKPAKREAVAPTPIPAPAAPAAAEDAATAPARNFSDKEMKQEFMGRSQLRARDAAGVAAPAASKPTQTEAVPEAEAAILEPGIWIEKIRALLKEGKKEEARKEFEAFKAAYPDYELPVDLINVFSRLSP